jgi:hypothetical protein
MRAIWCPANNGILCGTNPRDGNFDYRRAPANRALTAVCFSTKQWKVRMPMTPYLKEAVFDPKAIEALNAAFLAICKSLQLYRTDGTRTELIARKVIDIGRTGERDPQRIHDLVLHVLEELNKRSA